jgi:hypothetical protein
MLSMKGRSAITRPSRFPAAPQSDRGFGSGETPRGKTFCCAHRARRYQTGAANKRRV